MASPLSEAIAMKSHLPIILTLSVIPSGFAQDAPVRVSNRDQLVAALNQAKPGTTILIEAGTYRGGLSRGNLQGTADRPIVIAAADPEHPPVIEGGGSCLHLSDPAHVELRQLVLTGAEGNGLNIDDGGSRETPAHHVTMTGLVVRDVGPRGNRDGIKLSGLDDFHIDDCTVERWGSGGSGIDMVGCHNGVVAGCTFRNPGADQANGVQTKGGSHAIVIQRCRFDDAGGRAVNIGGSTGLPYFRPEPQGYEAKDITVEDCTFRGSMAPIAFVGVDGAVVSHNTIYRPGRWGIRILQETQGPDFVPCRNGRFENNIMAFRSDELRTLVNVGGETAPETFTFKGNVWYCLDRPAATRGLVRLPVRETEGVYNVDPDFAAPEDGDLTVQSTAAARAGVRPE
jgi:hypothetical protein